VFFAGRQDGLGARLAAMLDAIWLAERHGGRFLFHWPDQGQSPWETAIKPGASTFSPDFISAHHVGPGVVARLQMQSLRALAARGVSLEEALQPGSGIGGFVVAWPPLDQQLRHPVAGSAGADRRAAFARIGFSDDLERARALAQEAALPPGAVALHLRAGDVMEGFYRAGDNHHSRVIPYPVALDVLARSAAEGVPVVVFGQDAGLCAHARSAHGAILAADLAQGLGLDATARVVFEITLMARCARILAGHSAFAVAAAKIAGLQVVNPLRDLPPGRLATLVTQALTTPPSGYAPAPLQQAMAAWHGVMALRYDQKAPMCAALVEAAIRADPANPRYRAVAAIGRYAAGAPDEAERMLLAALAGPGTDGELRRFMFTKLRFTPVLNDPRTLALLEAEARAGRPVAALMRAICGRAAGDQTAWQAYGALYVAHRGAHMPATHEAVWEGTMAPPVSPATTGP
jgi:hypothetical protein